MIIGSFDCGWGLPTLIRVLLLALKYMEVFLFHFPFCFGGVFKVASTTITSLANISSDSPLCCYVSMLPVEVFVSTISACSAAILGSFFTFCFGVTVVAVLAFTWDVSAFFSSLQSLFPWCLCCCSLLYFRLTNLALSRFLFLSYLCLFVLCFFTTGFLSCFSVFPFFTTGWGDLLSQNSNIIIFGHVSENFPRDGDSVGVEGIFDQKFDEPMIG